MITRILLVCFLGFFSLNAMSYSINYDESSPIKTVPLKNTTLKIMVYYNGNPSGYMDVTTDADQKFTLDQFKDKKSVAIEVLSIMDQDKYKAICKNTPKSGMTEDILIRCTENNQG